jgi:zinc transport system substrate-binding protein
LPTILNAGTEKLTVYVVNYPLKYFAELIGGEHATVVFPAPGDEDPAYWMPDTKTISAYHGPKGKHAHEALAFTTWIDFDLAAKQAQAITDVLSRKRPKLRGGFEKNFSVLQKDLMALDRDIKAVVSRNPSKPLLASHPVYDYFARRYGLNIKSVHWEPDEIPIDEQWMELRSILRDHPAQWMIWEGEPIKASVEKLKSMGINSLVFDPCGNVPDQGDFMSVMRQNVENLKVAFE